MEHLPQDPFMLVSAINMLLRDGEFDSLEDLCSYFDRDMDEVKKCSNRIIALYEGRKAGEFSADADKEDILSAIIGVNS